MAAPLRVLIHSDRPHLFRGAIAARFPALELAECTSYAALDASLGRFAPQVVLSHKFEPRLYPADAIIRCASVQWVHLGGSGTDHFDARDRSRLQVTCSPGVTAVGIAEYVLSAILAANLRQRDYLGQQRNKVWQQLPMRKTAESNMLIVGLGAIGRQIAASGHTMGLRISGVNRSGRPVAHVDPVVPVARMRALLPVADYVVVVVPKTADTLGLIGASELALLKRDAVLVNVARGGIVDQAALTDVLALGRIRGAVLDVFDEEPLPAASPLWHMDRVTITPHAAGFVAGWESGVLRIFLDNLARWVGGAALAHLAE